MPAEGARRRVAVIGGGISGLTAAYVLSLARKNSEPVDEFLIEATDRLGGCIVTEHLDGFIVEGGPDSFLSEKPEAAALCRELDLGDALIGSNDAARRTYVLHRGRLVPLPDGLMLLVPTRLWPMVRTPLLPFRSKLAMAKEYFAAWPQRALAEDESVADFVCRHFGEGMLQNIADPLLAGVFGGDSAALSARSALPRFCEMERTYGSLTRAALATRRARRSHAKAVGGAGEGSALSIFTTLKGGLASLVEALKARLDLSRVCLRHRVVQIARVLERNSGAGTDSATAGYTLRCDDGSVQAADAIILAPPAYECGRLLAPLDATLATSLAGIPYTSALTVALAYDSAVHATLPPGFGFLVPRHQGLRMLACTFVHGKFDGRAPDGKALLRCFFGGARDGEALTLTDGEIIALARSEIEQVLGLAAEPLFARVYRWPASMPQYVVGHEARLGAIRERLAGLGGISLAGNAYAGIGLSDCIRAGRSAAEQALQFLKD